MRPMNVPALQLAAAFLLLCTTASCSNAGSPPSGSTSTLTISIVGTNDLHGAILPAEGRGGLALLDGFVRNLRAARAADGGAVVLLDAGDLFQGSLESNLTEGAVVISAYNALGYTAAAIGNALEGVSIASATNVTVGGTAAERNVISGNGRDGLRIAGPAGVVIVANYVGTDAGGSRALGNAADGVNVIDTPGVTFRRNVISGNRAYGVEFGGADARCTQTAALACALAGCLFADQIVVPRSMHARAVGVPEPEALSSVEIGLAHRVHRGEERRQDTPQRALVEIVERGAVNALRDAVRALRRVADLEDARGP